VAKMKVNKSLKSRFKVTRNKKLVCSKSGRRHLLEHKTAKRKRKMRTKSVLAKKITKNYLRMLSM
jgi:large subunit ribosomal protein L35